MTSQASKKALIAGMAGTALQWYDFALFGYFSSIIASTYFPNDNQTVSLMRSFSVFAVGYLLAPLGSLVFGYIGDKFGRKRALTLSILTMAIPTALMSLIPSYQSIGVTAPIILVTLRIIQGLVASSEFTGSAVFLVEHAKPGQKAFYGCLTSSAYSTGTLLAALVSSLLTASFMPEWGWRIGFSLALIAGIVIFYLRLQVRETPEYQQLSAEEKKGFPFFKALKRRPYACVGVIGIAWLVGVLTYGTYIFTGTYLHHYFNLPLSQATLIVTFALLVDAVFEPFMGLWADKIGFTPMIYTGMVMIALLSLPLFYLITSGNFLWVTLGLALMSALIAITCAPLNAYMISLFPEQYRYSAFSVAFNTGVSVFGGTAPLVMMWLVNTTGNTTSPAWYYLFSALVGLASLVLCEYSQSSVVLNKKISCSY